MNRLHPLAVLAMLAVLAACAPVSREVMQDQLAQTVSQRISRPVEWDAGAPENRIVREKVHRMLAGELTIDKALAIALVNNRELRAVLARANVARADLVQAGLLENPVFDFALLDGGAGTEIEYTLFQNFLNVFTLSARKKIAAGQLESARLEVAQTILDLIAGIKRGYYALLADRQALELYSQVLDATGAAAELAGRQYAAGTLSLREQALQQSFFAQAALEAARAEARFAADREKLNRLLGLWGPETAWKLPARLPDMPATLPDLADLERRAVTQRLDLASRRAEVEAVNMALGYTRQSRWLSVFGLSFTVQRDFDGTYSRGPGLELGLPLFDRNQGRIAKLEAELTEAENRYAQLAIDVRAQVREADARLAAAHGAVKHYREAILPLADQVTAETLKFYNGMLVGVYELLSAKQAQIEAARDYIETWRDFWIAWTDLERALGATLAPDAPGVRSSGAGPGDSQ
ncbi:MAG: TolC family protein [Desulfobacteraceae bacterium]|nr:MAG: TolC family protein [Desulfobacteraceae bacterium]